MNLPNVWDFLYNYSFVGTGDSLHRLFFCVGRRKVIDKIRTLVRSNYDTLRCTPHLRHLIPSIKYQIQSILLLIVHK